MASFFTIPELLKALAMLPPPDRFLLDSFFPTVFNSPREEIALDDIADDREIAAYVSPLVVAPAQKSAPMQVSTYKAPSVIEKKAIPPETMTTRRPNEPFNMPMSGQARVQDWIQEWSAKLRNRIVRREIQQASEILVDGKVTVEGENHPPMTIDYSRHADLSITLAGGSVWNGGDVNPFTAMKQAAEAGADHGLGAVLNTVVMDSKAWDLFSASDEVRDLLKLIRVQQAGINLDPNVTGRKVDDKGVIGGFRIFVYNDAYIDGSGNKVKFVPDNTVIMVDPAVFSGHRAFGMVPLTDEATGAYVPVSEEFVPDYLVQKEPVGIFYRLQSRPLMVPVTVNASARITVA